MIELETLPSWKVGQQRRLWGRHFLEPIARSRANINRIITKNLTIVFDSQDVIKSKKYKFKTKQLVNDIIY